MPTGPGYGFNDEIAPDTSRVVSGIETATGKARPLKTQADGTLEVAATVNVAADGAIVDGVDSTIRGTVRNYTNSKPQAVVLTNTAGDAYLAGGATPAATTALSNTAENVASVTVLASNASRLSFELYNDSDSAVNVKCGAVASATSFTKRMLARERWGTQNLGLNYTGKLDAIWDSAPGTAGHAAMRATEFTA